MRLTPRLLTALLVAALVSPVLAIPAASAAAPVAVDDGPASIAEDAAATMIDVLANDSDPDGDTLTIVSATDPANGTVVVDASGLSLTYQPDPNYNGPDLFSYTVDDGSAGQASALVHVDVTSVNDPFTAYPDSASVVQGSRATRIPVLSNDAAHDLADHGGDLHVASVTQGHHGTAAVGIGAGVATYKPTGDYVGSDTFTYTAYDGVHYSTATVTVSIPKDTYAPFATMPVQRVSGATIGTSTVVLALSWTGSDKGYGIARYELWQSVNGRAYTKVALSSPRATSRSITTRVGSSYRFKVRAIDRKGNVGAFAYGPRFTVLLFQESAPEFTFTSTWSRWTGIGYSGGHSSITRTPHDEVSFTTTGTTFAWISSKGPGRGDADIELDGQLFLEERVHLSSSTSTYRYVANSIGTGLTSQPHTFRILCVGNAARRVDVDAFVVLR